MVKRYLLLFFVLIITIFSCKKEESTFVVKKDPPGFDQKDTTSTNPKDTNTTGNQDTTKVDPIIKTKLSFEFNPLIGSESLVYGKVFTDSLGNNFTISAAQFYVSGITLTKSDKSQTSFKSIYLMVKPSITKYSIDSVFTGDYTGISFQAGIDAAHNDPHADPTTYPDGSALGVHSPSMYWTWTDLGYIFMKVQGTVDTSVAHTGKYVAFSANIGTNALLKTVALNKSFKIDKTSNSIVIDVDFKKFFKGFLLKDIKTDTGDNPTQAAKLSANIPGMFEMK